MAQTEAQADFPQLADPYRRELLAHCYRMLGSVHDAEDLVQETYLRAWRAYDKFEGRSSLRTWLHTIATRACLTALESRGKRPLPTGLGAPSSSASDELITQDEVPWLEPIPDTMIDGGGTADPASVVGSRESVRLAFIAALQHLPPKQRAVLILRDVLKWKAAEVAEQLELTTAAVNSALQRAHAAMGKAGLTEESVQEPDDAEQRRLLDSWMAAFEAKDMRAIVRLFTEDAVWEMPPFIGWYQGPETIGQLIDTSCPAKGPGDQRLVPTTANGQPAFGLYMIDPETGDHKAFQLQVLDIVGGRVRHCVAFFETSLFETFGLPAVLPAQR
ncbi:ECF RNA polymerase sigma factor SigG [Streptomyces sp. RB5]|uniref:RNA polymerase sigma factor n=2 Tax=Streptomyces smaragdinus TaxID=2585196 RepID=A0A7K0CQC3_9ACTN|nr:ECF RNA polymerase sigma factor SigG [Streptomyces smaragdinus]